MYRNIAQPFINDLSQQAATLEQAALKCEGFAAHLIGELRQLALDRSQSLRLEATNLRNFIESVQSQLDT